MGGGGGKIANEETAMLVLSEGRCILVFATTREGPMTTQAYDV